jgi:hypothetical protein
MVLPPEPVSVPPAPAVEEPPVPVALPPVPPGLSSEQLTAKRAPKNIMTKEYRGMV